MSDSIRPPCVRPGWPFLAGIFFALLGVALGAFGAHGLRGTLIERETLAVWETAVDYQFWHALALLALGLARLESRLVAMAAALLTVGVVLFSGSLYWLALGGPRWLGPVTPLGGLALMAGWAVLGAFAVRRRDGFAE